MTRMMWSTSVAVSPHLGSGSHSRRGSAILILRQSRVEPLRGQPSGHAMTGDRRRTGAEKRQRDGKQFAHLIIDDHTRRRSPSCTTTNEPRP